MAQIDTYLIDMLDQGGSDLHLNVGMPPKIRKDGHLLTMNYPALTREMMESTLSEICPKKRWNHFVKNNDLDFAHEIPGRARFRANYLCNHWGQAAVLRQIPAKILTMEDLNLPETLKEICGYKEGLVFVTGPTGSGKSTTLAAMIDYINETYEKHIITIEDPIEFVHPNKNCVIVHREVGEHSDSFSDALMGAMRADPDIVLVGEMRDLETIKIALACASMGMLVFGTLHTNNAPKTIDRVIDAFPADEQSQIRTMLADSLSAVVSQLLCRKQGGGRVAVHEILLSHDALPNTIREGQIANIRSIIDGSRAQGMCTMDSTLKARLDDGSITAEEAYMKAADKKLFEHLVSGQLL